MQTLFTYSRPRPRLIPALIVAVVVAAALLLSLAAGALAGNGHLLRTLLLIGPPALVGMAVLISRKFETAVLALPILALAVPIELPTGTFSKIPISLALALALCAVWLVAMALRRRFQLAPSPLNRPLVLFCVACCVSLVWGNVWWDPPVAGDTYLGFTLVQVASLVTLLASMGAALLIGNFVQTEGRLKFIAGAFLACGTLMTATQLLKIPQPILNDRGLWGLWTVVPAACLLIAQPQLRWRWRALLLLLIVAHLYQAMVVNLLWKSGWIPVIVGLFVAVLLRSWRWFLVLLAVGALFAYTQRDIINDMVNSEVEEGADERIGMWEINLRVVGDHWLFGSGPAGYALYYMHYYPEDARSTHNNYLDIIAQFGVVGSAIWIWLAAASTIEGVRLYRRAPPGFLRTLALAVTSGWVGAQVSMLLGDWMLPFAYNQTITGYKYTVYSWIFLGMLISIRTLLPHQPGTIVVEEPA
ncbi:MAG TPA: O-antigen ligase family protein [Roseiflexaceae bacterium]|nr:O-antigen ligase family protein [Roseiflexaceae bacterium]